MEAESNYMTTNNHVGTNERVHRIVLTGGPCGGKTTSQARLSTFFENLGWKVYRVPETATVLMSGGIKFSDLDDKQVFQFQENLISTMMQVEQTFFDLASSSSQKVLIICDRGVMDATAYLKPGQWEIMSKKNNWNEILVRDGRYNQVIHMVSAAVGAEDFYQINTHVTRSESIDVARELDVRCSHAWIGHPYFDVIDNSTDFDGKVVRMIAVVCNRLGIEAGDRLALDSKKRKFLIKHERGSKEFPCYQDFIVVHDYLVTPNCRSQARVRRRGKNVKCGSSGCAFAKDSPGNWTYTHTIRRPEINKESPEVKMQINTREYELLLAQKDQAHHTVFKKRRCFISNSQYFQMDYYQEPCNPRCKGLVILETYTTHKGKMNLPDFLTIEREVTDDPAYSMFNLSKIEQC